MFAKCDGNAMLPQHLITIGAFGLRLKKKQRVNLASDSGLLVLLFCFCCSLGTSGWIITEEPEHLYSAVGGVGGPYQVEVVSYNLVSCWRLYVRSFRMDLWMRRESLIFLLVFTLHAIFYSKGINAKNKRQSDLWWRKYHSISGWGTPRGMGWGDVPSVFGWNSLRSYSPDDSQSVPAYSSSRSLSGHLDPTQSSPTPGPIALQCHPEKLVVTVRKDFYGNGKLVRTSDLTLGSLTCKPGLPSSDTAVVFEYGLHECGTRLEMTEDSLVYSTFLLYNPSPSRRSTIIRSNSAMVPIKCFYPRHHNVSSDAIKPTWIPSHSTVSVEEKLSFTLQLMTDDWRSRRSSTVFQLGDIFHIEALVDTQNHAPMRIFVDRCVATQSPDASSSPSHEIITQNGCLMDGKLEDSSSAFKTPRPRPDKLQFTVDAFRFAGPDNPMIFITCVLRAEDAEVVPDATSKACSFNKTNGMWHSVDGLDNICSCCEMENCVLSSTQSRRFSRNSQRRLPQKRDLWVLLF
ncbi:hypothetical protein GDO81_008953 [Engystomops pustulosus]|uniref:Zona pellucida sperm-binding protein 3 n=1 Tax=Engystomops pustulosus TaxID=76066 RepID=A0AAV7BMM9_ENGPU|nr:hypothetical protein GDO81_008953 [Engystomops pustulosus]